MMTITLCSRRSQLIYYSVKISKITGSLMRGSDRTEGLFLSSPKEYSNSNLTLDKSSFANNDINDENEESDLNNTPDNYRHLAPRTQPKPIFDLLETGTFEEITNCIESLLIGNKMEFIINSEGLGLLHVACQNDNMELAHYLIEKAEEQSDKKYIKMLVNMKCKNRQMSFTPAHFCAYNGNIDMLNFLISNGANLMIPNDQGVKVLHVAAQGDQAAMVYYLLKTQKCDIEDKDTSGNTPLHWAIFTGSESSTNFLLALGADANALNHEISTPLHLSIKSIEEHGSIRNVKALLLEGAKRETRDYTNSMAIDYVDNIEDQLLANDLIQILAQPRSWLCCLLKTPLQKLEKTRKILFQFYSLLTVNYIGMFVMIFPYVHLIYVVIHTLLTTVLFVLVTMLSRNDPGYVLKDNSLDFQRLLETGSLDKICPQCEIAITSKIRHCRFCNKCIEGYDHHCPWINNCVGSKNHNIFLVFITLLLIFLLYNICFSIPIVPNFKPKDYSNFLNIHVIEEILCKYEWFYRFFLIFNIIVCFIASLLNAYVFWIQFGNYFNNATTYERFSHEGATLRKKKKKFIDKVRKNRSPDSTISSRFFEKYKDKNINSSTDIFDHNAISNARLIDDKDDKSDDKSKHNDSEFNKEEHSASIISTI